MSSVFVYGTLRPGQVKYSIVSPAVTEKVPARLDDHALRAAVRAGFPYATVADGHQVVGDLLRLERSAETDLLGVLDRLEGYRPKAVSGSHFVRVRRRVTTTVASSYGPAGTVVEAWLYLAGPRIRLDSLDLVNGGDWTTRSPVTPPPVRRWP